jgi:NADH:ubiquinone oxidoreductase subunit 3 (subunit A)
MWNKISFAKNKTGSNTITAMIVLLPVLFFAIFALSPVAHASAGGNNGRVYGQVLNGTNHNAPVAGQKVTLQLWDDGAEIDLNPVTTDAHGNFSFTGLQIDSAISYAAYTSFQGAQYTTPQTSLAKNPTLHTNLMVYDATTSISKIAIVQATVLLQPVNTQKDLIPVSELLIFRNLTNRTYVGSLNTSQGMPNTLRFALPHTANNLVLGTGFNGYQAVEIPGGFASNAAVPPGDTQFSFTFDAPFSIADYDFDYQVLYPTVRLSMLVSTSIHAASDTLTAQGPQTAGSQTYNVFTGTALLPGKTIHLSLDNLPVSGSIANSSPTASSTAAPNWLYLLIVIAIMALIILFTLMTTRAARAKRPTSKTNRSRATRRKHAAPKVEKATASTINREATRKQSAEADSEESLSQQMLELDNAYEAGKVKKSEYGQRRAKLKARLRELTDEKVTS